MITNYYETILKNIEIGDIAVYYLPSNYEEPTYWLVTQVDMEDKTIYGKQVARHNSTSMFSYIPEEEAFQQRWISIFDLDLKATVELNNYELEQHTGFKLEIYKPGYEEPEEELEEEVCNEFDAMVYHVEYNLDYARGISLKEILPSEIIKFEGSIVSKGKVWVFQTTMGCVIIPFESIIHMHPQY